VFLKISAWLKELFLPGLRYRTRIFDEAASDLLSLELGHTVKEALARARHRARLPRPIRIRTPGSPDCWTTPSPDYRRPDRMICAEYASPDGTVFCSTTSI
jgi:hypothetical protein